MPQYRSSRTICHALQESELQATTKWEIASVLELRYPFSTCSRRVRKPPLACWNVRPDVQFPSHRQTRRDIKWLRPRRIVTAHAVVILSKDASACGDPNTHILGCVAHEDDAAQKFAHASSGKYNIPCASRVFVLPVQQGLRASIR